MKLMFWKKKTGTGEEAAPGSPAGNAKPRESLDFVAAKQDAEHSAKSPEPDSSVATETEPETPYGQKLAAQAKLWLGSIIRRFRRSPAFRAEATPETEEDQAAQPDESPAPEAVAKAGLFMRLKAGFAAFAREVKAPSAPPAEDEEKEAPPVEPEVFYEDEVEAQPVHSRKWLVVGGSLVIVVLLLLDIALTFWVVYEPPQKRWGTRHDITSISSRPLDDESTPVESEAEALKRENAELQARIEALKKEQPQQRPYAVSTAQTGGGSMASSGVAGEMTVGGKDPKAAAMTLKEAIEAMNAGTGDYKKPAK